MMTNREPISAVRGLVEYLESFIPEPELLERLAEDSDNWAQDNNETSKETERARILAHRIRALKQASQTHYLAEMIQEKQRQ